MTTAIRNVVVAGPNGTLGKPVISNLSAAGFALTLLTRDVPKTEASFPNLKVAKVDFTSASALAQQIRQAAPGAQALVSLLNREQIEAQMLLIDAAIEAGIPHIVPSCFGVGSRDTYLRNIPTWTAKVRMEDYIREKADQGKCTWTGIQNAVFFDWALANRVFLLNTKGRKKGPLPEGSDSMDGVTTIFDGGNIQISTTTLNDIGKATAAALKKKDEVLNRDLFVNSAVVTQNQILEYAQEAAPNLEFPVMHLDTAKMEREAWEKWNSGDKTPAATRGFMPRAYFGLGLGHFKSTDNELLGIEQMDDTKIKEFVRRYVKP